MAEAGNQPDREPGVDIGTPAPLRMDPPTSRGTGARSRRAGTGTAGTGTVPT